MAIKFYDTNSSILVVKNMLCSKLDCQKVFNLILFLHKIPEPKHLKPHITEPRNPSLRRGSAPDASLQVPHRHPKPETPKLKPNIQLPGLAQLSRIPNEPSQLTAGSLPTLESRIPKPQKPNPKSNFVAVLSAPAICADHSATLSRVSYPYTRPRIGGLP